MAHYGELPVEHLETFANTTGAQLATPVDPDMARLALARSGMFDADFYLTRYPDIAAASVDPLEHYVRHGASEGRMPALWFDSGFYLADNPDLGIAHINPFLHFLRVGYKEGRRPNPECQKRKKRLILAILAGESDLRDAAKMAMQAARNTRPPDVITVWHCLGANEVGIGANALMDLLEAGAHLRPYKKDEPGAPLTATLTDYPDDAILFIHPLAALPQDWLRAFRTAWRAAPDAIHVVRSNFILLRDGHIDIAEWSANDNDSSRKLPIPVVSAGVLLPPGKCQGLLANIQRYRRFAPDYPDIWLATQALLEKTEIKHLPAAAQLKLQPSLNKTAKHFLKEPFFAAWRRIISYMNNTSHKV